VSKARLYIPFALALAVQLVMLGAVPFKKIMPKIAGTTVVLKIEPVDPYHSFKGYYLDLRYEISRPKPAAQWNDLARNAIVYTVLARGDDGFWHAVSVHDRRPETLDEGAVVIRGRKKHSRINYGIEAYYVPEEVRGAIERDLRGHIDKARAEVAVGPFGNAVILRLRVGNRTYEY